MNKKLLTILFSFVFLFSIYSVALAVDLSGLVLTKDLVNKATLMYGTKGKFCEIEFPVTGRQLLTQNIHEQSFSLTDSKDIPCKGNEEEIIFANIYVDFKKSIETVEGNGFLYVLFRDQLLQENNKAFSSVDYPNAPENFSFNFFNGGEEGNIPANEESPTDGDPKGLKYIRIGNLLQIDSQLQDGFKPVRDSGYLMHFDENGKRKSLLFIYENKIFKMLSAERKYGGAVLVDYSDIPEASGSPSTSVVENMNTYVNPKFNYIIKYPQGLIDTNTSTDNGIALHEVFPPENDNPFMFALTAQENNLETDDPKEIFGKYGNTKYSQDALENLEVKKIMVGRDVSYVVQDVPVGNTTLSRDQIILNKDVVVNIQTFDNGNENTRKLIDQILSSFKLAD